MLEITNTAPSSPRDVPPAAVDVYGTLAKTTSSASEDADGNDEANDEVRRLPSKEFEKRALEFTKKLSMSTDTADKVPSTRSLVVKNVIDNEDGGSRSGSHGGKDHHPKKKGAFAGVFVPTCENMWGVLIFLRFHFIVGEAGVLQALAAVFLSFTCAFCTTSSMCATVSSGGFVSKGGPYYMISRALGPSVGASMGIVYWLAFTMLAVLEVLGAVEGILMASEEARFSMCEQVYGSAMMLALALMVWGGINFVTKMGLLFCLIVFFTLFIYYYGLVVSPYTDEAKANPLVTGLDFDTFRGNWASHYNEGVNFGSVLSVFFPCFTGILSGANRADVLRDPPKALRQGTFGAIIFSLFVYSSFMILWGAVAEYRYLQGAEGAVGSDASHRRLAGGAVGGHVVQEIVWNPFPHAAHVGIIISSLSQALQCLIVAPRLLQAIAKDKIISMLNPLAPLSHGEPARALGATYVIGALLVLMGQLDLVAPLLSMCFLTAYMYMNLSCFALTVLKPASWRPKGIHQKRWRLWYVFTSGLGAVVCIAIMFTIDTWWALVAFLMSGTLYFYVNWRLEEKDWGSAMDGIRFQLALTSLVSLEGKENHMVNWRPQVLVLYRIDLAAELNFNPHHEILRFCSQLRKSKGFCMVACVLEADRTDEHAIHKAKAEKVIIRSIMKAEKLDGFAEVVVAPSWVEGTNYIIQLTGVGGLSPNTVLLDWPEGWRRTPSKAQDFVQILTTALAGEKAVLAVKGLRHMPSEIVHGTIDVWWVLHDGGFLILLSWLLVQHRIWRQCHLRVFTITEDVSPEKAQAAALLLTKALRQRRLFDVDVEVIVADDEMIEPYTYHEHERIEERHRFLSTLHPGELEGDMYRRESIPLEIHDLFQMEADNAQREHVNPKKASKESDEDVFPTGSVVVSDIRRPSTKESVRPSCLSEAATPNLDTEAAAVASPDAKKMLPPGAYLRQQSGDSQVRCPSRATHESRPPPTMAGDSIILPIPDALEPLPSSEEISRKVSIDSNVKTYISALNAWANPWENVSVGANENREMVTAADHNDRVQALMRLNQIIYSRSKRSQLVVMNLPDHSGPSKQQVLQFMSYCEGLTKGLERVLFVHATGHEVFDITP